MGQPAHIQSSSVHPLTAVRCPEAPFAAPRALSTPRTTFCRFFSRCLAVQAPFSPTQCEGRNQTQDKTTPCAAAWLKHAVTRSCLFTLCQLFLLAPSFLTYFKSASNSSITSIYFPNTPIPLNRVFMLGSRRCKHSAEIKHSLAAAPGILTGYLPLFKLSKSGCFLNTIRTKV